MSQPVIGKSVDGWCARCKLMLAHTIEAVVNGKITRTHCNTCGAQHAHRKSAPGTAAKRASGGARAAKNAPPAFDYEALLRGKDVKNARPYRLSDRFECKELINHPTFGIGQVVAVRDSTKIDVGFSDGMKTLAHGVSR
ncbi:MAG TPA: hypothetical protein VEB21_14575 [Terriglobales bacterium]|nr:hypothetical protein [Terriglobales bacterium]